jgi:hypothetical protein
MLSRQPSGENMSGSSGPKHNTSGE